MHDTPKRQTGLGVIQLVIFSALAAVSTFYFQSALLGSARLERGIASNSELESFSDILRLYFSKKATCALTGLVGQTVNPANPKMTPIVLTLPDSGVALAAGTTLMNTRKVKALYFDRIEHVAGNDYIGNLVMDTEVTGGKTTSVRNPKKRFTLALALSAANQIQSCSLSDLATGFVPSCSWLSYDFQHKKLITNDLDPYDAYLGTSLPAGLTDASLKTSGWACDWARVKDNCHCPSGMIVSGYDLFDCPGGPYQLRARCYCCTFSAN